MQALYPGVMCNEIIVAESRNSFCIKFPLLRVWKFSIGTGLLYPWQRLASNGNYRQKGCIVLLGCQDRCTVIGRTFGYYPLCTSCFGRLCAYEKSRFRLWHPDARTVQSSLDAWCCLARSGGQPERLLALVIGAVSGGLPRRSGQNSWRGLSVEEGASVPSGCSGRVPALLSASVSKDQIRVGLDLLSVRAAGQCPVVVRGGLAS